jgi:glycosyltransferase involved in cell wall biosynthesis
MLSLEDNTIFFGFADNFQLIDLYYYSLGLVSPSYIEGFGLPCLEAVYCGKLIAISDIQVYREIWTDSAIYFDPSQIENMSQAILKICNLNHIQYKQKHKKLYTRLKNFDYRKSIDKTLRIYEQVFKN